MDEARLVRLRNWLASAAQAGTVAIADPERLSGGAIQQNWLIRAAVAGGPFNGEQRWVLRTDNPSSVSVSHSREQEFALLKAAFTAGVTVPEPLFLCEDSTVLGKPFFVMRQVMGLAQGFRIVKDDALGGGRETLVTALGRELARIHSIRPPRPDLGFLPPPDARGPALGLIAACRASLDRGRMARLVLEWGLRWLELNQPAPSEIVLCHRDFRTGNYMVTTAGVTGVLDWEFAGWGDPLEDIGWFCAKCWRFGNIGQEAGGVDSREAFYRGYEAESGRQVKRDDVRYWEVMATIRWALIAADQAERHLSGAEPDLELALTGHILPELERDVLAMTVRA